MNKPLLLLVIIGLAVVGWFNRETISGWVVKKTAEVTQSPVFGRHSATPNPARESAALATRLYPELAKGGSAFNLRFVALYNEMKLSDPNLLAQPNWPIQLAERTVRELGGGSISGSGIQRISGWTDDYDGAMEAAKSENKKLLLDFTGSDWCEYCMKLDREVLNNPKFQAWARDNVVLVRVDFPRTFPQSTRIKNQNAQLKSKYPFDSYPTILVVDTNGNVLDRKIGYTPGSGLTRIWFRYNIP
jgi:protein disulfide-isomerase